MRFLNGVVGANWGKRYVILHRFLTQSCTGAKQVELNSKLKHDIEKHWHSAILKGNFDPSQTKNKHYVLSMFPYPSGNLHMGHVRVYTISDAVARFHRMCGRNVFQPIGWDSFGLPAENAAIEKGVDPTKWTKENIAQMKQQLQRLGCSFDWNHELSTCSPDYYKWTQHLFLMLYKEGLVYQNEALVNWDPVDKTVLADEQVDNNGCSWRSGAKVEKKLLRQWFVRTTAFAKSLLDGLSDPALRDWRDIINLQKHWIGTCDGYSFHLPTSVGGNSLRIWTQNPEYLKDQNAFLIVKPTHYLAKAEHAERMTIENPFTNSVMPVIFSDKPSFPEDCDVYLAAPSFREEDRELHVKFSLSFFNQENDLTLQQDSIELRKQVLSEAKEMKLGGFPVSSKLKDWLISRQRYWGTPIPIVHCDNCGPVPIPEEQLPVLLPQKTSANPNPNPKCKCPSCGSKQARRDSDTMDTFVDSSWYYLRYLDPHNKDQIFDEHLIQKHMPVDLYIGGKEHAVLHLYYARFMNHFLYSKGLVPKPEPFSRLLVQGMVMGRSFRLKGSGRYVKEDETVVVNAKKNQAVMKYTGEPVVMSWEKMSKSKLNGVDPKDMFDQYGTDTTRLIILADVAPTSHRNWSNATFPGILNWQKRLWLTVEEFYKLRSSEAGEDCNLQSQQFLTEDEKLFDARNFYVKGATFNFLHAHQLSVGISKMQGLTNSIRRAPKYIMRYGKEFERALASQIIMLAPIAPHFASELWSKFVEAPNRVNVDSPEIQWDLDVLQQTWPDVDHHYNLDLSVKVNGFENCVIKMPRHSLDKITHNDAMDLAFNTDSVTSYLVDKKIRTTNFVLYHGIEAVLHIYVDKIQVPKEEKSSSSEKVIQK